MLERVDIDTAAKFLESLPLGDAPLEYCHVSKETGRKAPLGKAFRMTGQFWKEQDYSNYYENEAPLQSTALFIADNQEHYDWLLAEFGGDEERALEELRSDLKDNEFEFEDVPSEFTGKWLVVRLGNPLSVRVKQDPMVLAQRQTLGIVRPPEKDSYEDPIIMHDYGPLQLVWYQYCADGVVGKCNVELVDYEEPEESLFVPEPENTSQIELPEYLTPTPKSTEYPEYYRQVLGIELTEEGRLALMRSRRWERDIFTGRRRTLSDDPLRHFLLPKRRVDTPKKREIVLPEREKRRWIIKPGQEHLVERYRKIERGEIQF
jgi:hypothetical protein